MTLAAYASSGAGCAFCMLLPLALMGLMVTSEKMIRQPALFRRPASYALLAAFLQAGVLYGWVRLGDALTDAYQFVGWAWAASMAIVVVALVLSAKFGRSD